MRHLHVLSTLLIAASAFAGEGTKLSSEFASNGFLPTLQTCKLPTSCAGLPFTKNSRRVRETSNDIVVDQRTFSLHGLEIEGWYVLESPAGKKVKNPYKKFSVLSLTITQPTWPVTHGLRVGSSQELVSQRLGSGTSNGQCTVYVNQAKQDEVTFCFKQGVVQSIKWVPWNDA